MGTLIQIRDVNDEVHRTLKARAARKGVSLSEYLRAELERVAGSPNPAELLARLRARKPGRPGGTGAALRASRDNQAWSSSTRRRSLMGCSTPSGTATSRNG